ncbi:helix-turn-helix domain-containing protein [Amycolatopsis thailandensis]|uniref:helix-turn-helix domain-containing protein n=1 Tax=Amycolatopsis thailandensis TaxID=589330 RepID=UPI0036409307
MDIRRRPRRQPAPPELVAAYRAGASLDRIAADTSRSYRDVRTALIDAGVILRSPKAVVAPCPPGMISSYEHGTFIRQLAAKYGNSYNVTRTMLLNAGVTLRPRGAVPYMIGER